MTDPIEQARHSALIGASNAVVLGILAGDAYEPMIAYEQAILHHHPDVVRLVLAARQTVAASARDGWLDRFGLEDALDPFKEVQE